MASISVALVNLLIVILVKLCITKIFNAMISLKIHYLYVTILISCQFFKEMERKDFFKGMERN